MSETWHSNDVPPEPRLTWAGWIRCLLRALPFAVICFGGLGILVLIRLVERPLFHLRRPITPYLQQGVCKAFLLIAGIRLIRSGTPMRTRGAMVANHTSWSDIFTLSARQRIFFVAKSEVSRWPAIGLLARATGTVFISRQRHQAKVQQGVFFDRLLAGHKLMFFPEGTSTDGRRVLTFKSTLFAAFLAPELRDVLHIQPVTVIHHAPDGQDPRFYGWWGEMSFAAHLMKILGARRQGSIEVIYHPPMKVSDFSDRKALALACEEAVRGGMPWDYQIKG